MSVHPINGSVSAAARQLGIGRSTLRYHIARGNAVLDARGQVDVAATRVMLGRLGDVAQNPAEFSLSNAKVLGPGLRIARADDGPPLWQAKAKTELVRGELLQLTLNERTGHYLLASQVESEWSRFMLAASGSLMAIPARVVARMRAAKSDHEAESMLAIELRATLRILAGEAATTEN